MSGFAAAERAALDRATVPAMRAGLARDIVAAAGMGVAPVRRRARGGWRRHGRVLIGAGALVIASATAAATGLFDALPIRIPGITRAAEAPKPKPKHVAHAEKPRPAPGQAVPLAQIVPAPVPLVDPTPVPAMWRERRAERIAAGLPVRRTLVQRALAAKLRGLSPDQRQAAMTEWRRIRTLPPAERRIAVAKLRADFLATHPKAAARYEARLEARSAAAAAGPGDPQAPPAPVARAAPAGGPPVAVPPLPPGLTAAERADRRRAWFQSLPPEQRRQLRAWRQERRAERLAAGSEGAGAPQR